MGTPVGATTIESTRTLSTNKSKFRLDLTLGLKETGLLHSKFYISRPLWAQSYFDGYQTLRYAKTCITPDPAC